MNFASPSAFRKYLTVQAKNTARTTGRTVGDLLQQHYLARLMARVFHDDPVGWLIKGGQAMLVRYPDARHSRDVDLVYSGNDEPDMDEAVAALRRAADIDLHDFVRFDFYDSRKPSVDSSGRSVRFNTYIGTTMVVTLGVDLVVDHQPIGTPVTRKLEPVIDIDDDVVWPFVRLYPIIDTLADKISAMLELHGEDNAPSSRYRDLVDLILIIQAEHIDGPELHAVLRTEVARRQARNIVITLPQAFTSPDPDTWPVGYRKQAANVPGLDEFRTMDTALALAATFIDPLLIGQPPGNWNPQRREWGPRTAP